MDPQTLWSPFLGGVMIGMAASLLLWSSGRIAGVSGWIGGALMPAHGDGAWRYFALLGLMLAGIATMMIAPSRISASPRSLAVLAVAGVLVGAGTRIGNGCTSGHGVCGVSRGSRRSIVATTTFVATGALTTLALRALQVVP
jgi:uncharacterized membrane protein YedE/YeeE